MDAPPLPPTPDRLSGLLRHFHVQARMFHSGPLCGTTGFYDGPDYGYLHVLQAGSLKIAHYGDASPLGEATLTEPTLVFYPAAAPHRFITPTDGSTRMVCATLRFEAGPAHPVAAALPPLLLVPLAEVAPVAHTSRALFAEAMPDDGTAAPACGRQLVCDRLFEALLVQLLRWLIDRGQPPGQAHAASAAPAQSLLAGLAHPQLARALTALHEQPGAPWDLPGLAGAAGMSRSAFAAAFRNTVGSTPGDYLARWRVVLAAQQLARGTPLKQVAFRLGYSSPAALSRAFAAHRGQTPRAWLKSQEASESY
ncbi:MAG: helix-turn-helix transcriptional regulator [Ramlibacter sp.]|nr:helix-turn-helix transcriptional regulator [Ramlibacter sp.]